MSSKHTCICLTHAVYTKCENNCVGEKEATIYSHNGSAGFRYLKQQWISWSSLVSVETQRVMKGQKWAVPRRSKMGLPRRAYRYLRKEWNTDIKNELSNLDYCQRPPIQSFFISCLRLGLLFEACSPNSDLGNAKKSLGTADSSHSRVNGCIF